MNITHNICNIFVIYHANVNLEDKLIKFLIKINCHNLVNESSSKTNIRSVQDQLNYN